MISIDDVVQVGGVYGRVRDRRRQPYQSSFEYLVRLVTGPEVWVEEARVVEVRRRQLVRVSMVPKDEHDRILLEKDSEIRKLEHACSAYRQHLDSLARALTGGAAPYVPERLVSLAYDKNHAIKTLKNEMEERQSAFDNMLGFRDARIQDLEQKLRVTYREGENHAAWCLRRVSEHGYEKVGRRFSNPDVDEAAQYIGKSWTQVNKVACALEEAGVFELEDGLEIETEPLLDALDRLVKERDSERVTADLLGRQRKELQDETVLLKRTIEEAHQTNLELSRKLERAEARVEIRAGDTVKITEFRFFLGAQRYAVGQQIKLASAQRGRGADSDWLLVREEGSSQDFWCRCRHVD